MSDNNQERIDLLALILRRRIWMQNHRTVMESILRIAGARRRRLKHNIIRVG